jgi:hypothetical protein
MCQLVRFLLQSLVLALVFGSISAATDKTLIEREKGKDVVDAVVNRIRSSNIFTEDYQLLRRMAYVETLDGESNSTYATRAGIWNVAEVYYNRTKDASLDSFHTKINDLFSINWGSTTWNDLLKPFYNGLAARLYLQYLNMTIPQTIKDQASFWDQRYNRHDDWNNATFADRGEQFDNSTNICTGKMDYVIVLDGSESVTYPNYELCKRFVMDLISVHPLQKVRHGFIVFGSEAQQVFSLDNYLTLEELKGAVYDFPYPSSKTNTNEALQEAYRTFLESEERPGVPKVMTILTDGISNPKGVENIQLLKNLGVASYAIGVTSLVDLRELEELAYNTTGNVFSLFNFEVLQEFYRRINAETCKVAQKPELDTPEEDTVVQGELRYYSFQVPEEGITISTESQEGRIAGYYSFTEETPNSAVNDGVLSYLGTLILPPGALMQMSGPLADEDGPTVFVSVQGLDAFNSYIIEAITGDAVANATTTTPGPGAESTPEGATSAFLAAGVLLISIASRLLVDV